MESVIEDNARFLAIAEKHGVNIVLIDDRYEIDIDLSVASKIPCFSFGQC